MSFYIGVDESGKGDFFGPLVIAGVVSNETINEKLLNAGVKDSKKLSDKKIFEIFERIKEICQFYEVVVIKPKRYNELTKKLNLNKLLAWGHARVIENLLEKAEQENFEINKIISDQFGDASYLLNALMKRGKKINLIQMHKAEIDPAVASASIIARAVFLNQLVEMSRKYEIPFPKGVSAKVVDVAKEIVKRFGKDELLNVAKIHFKTTSQVLVKL
ncbi:MAG: ribonuclease HIII [Candidatus Kryptonium sp.]